MTEGSRGQRPMSGTTVLATSGVDEGTSEGCISASIRSAIFWAGSRSWAMVQSAAYPWVTSLGRAWLDQPLGERGGGSISSRSATVNEGIAQAVEPELRPAGLADPGIEMMRILDMAGCAGRRGEQPLPNAFWQIRGGGLTAFENGRELIGDGKLQGHAGLGFLDPEGERVHVDALPAKRQHLVPSHAGVETEPEGVADRRVVDLRLDAGAPARQHLGRRRNLAPRLAVELTAARKPEIDRVAQPVMVDAGPAVGRAEQGHRPVCGPTIHGRW